MVLVVLTRLGTCEFESSTGENIARMQNRVVVYSPWFSVCSFCFFLLLSMM